MLDMVFFLNLFLLIYCYRYLRVSMNVFVILGLSCDVNYVFMNLYKLIIFSLF